MGIYLRVETPRYQRREPPRVFRSFTSQPPEKVQELPLINVFRMVGESALKRLNLKVIPPPPLGAPFYRDPHLLPFLAWSTFLQLLKRRKFYTNTR
jgi:hypothetical protein